MMRAVVEQAMLSEAARDAFIAGWSLDEIRAAVCVSCGDIRLPFPLDAHRAAKEGRKIGYRKNGSQYDAGRLCERCMTSKDFNTQEQSDG